MLIPSSWSCARALKDAATLFGSHGGGSKNCLPITDFKERGGQSQRRKTGFLWIREAGIPLLGESSSNGAGWGFFEEFHRLFAQPVVPARAIFTPGSAKHK
jgi:hypothetical protein